MDKIRILYAEDDADMAELNKDFLERRGFEVTWACNGDEAWDLYCTTDQDVVLMDVMMPGKSGYDVARLIRSRDAEIPIFILTSLSSSSDAVTAFDLGVNDFIRKECMMTEVEARINAVLKRKPNVWNDDTSFFRLSPQTTFNSNLRQLVINGEMRKLTTNEARLLKLLCLRINNCAEKEYLCKGIWGFYDLTKNRYLDRDIVKIRKYLAPDSQLRVVNEFGVGFILTN